MTRDLTKKQFLKQLEKRGMRILPFMGYVDIGNGVSVSRLNAGTRLRSQLAYLIASQAKHA